MPVTINSSGGTRKPSSVDRIAQGLQIANSGLGLYVNWERVGQIQQEKELNQNKIDSAKRIAAGTPTRTDLSSNNYGYVPKSPLQPPKNDGSPVQPPADWHAPMALPPDQTQGSATTTPAQKTPGDRFKNIVQFPVKVEGQEGYAYNRDQLKDLEEQRDKAKAEVRNVEHEYDRPLDAAQQIFGLGKKGVHKMLPTDDFLLVKLFNQFADSPRVTDSEFANVQASQGMLDWLKTKVSGFKDGDRLSPVLRANLLKTTSDVFSGLLQEQGQRLQGTYTSSVNRGLPLDEIFSPDQLSILNGKADEVKAKYQPSASAMKTTLPVDPVADEMRRRGIQ